MSVQAMQHEGHLAYKTYCFLQSKALLHSCGGLTNQTSQKVLFNIFEAVVYTEKKTKVDKPKINLPSTQLFGEVINLQLQI